MVKGKFIIYQLLIRAFGTRECVPGGSYGLNGSGKFGDISADVLRKYRKMSVDTIWYTGVISHATRTRFPNIPSGNPSIVKGEAGSPYAIRNYFDVDPALARNVDFRMQEFESLVARTHDAGMRVMIDFVPNHVAREYGGYFTKENYYPLDGPLELPFESDYVESPARATGNNVFNPRPSVNDWYECVKLNYESRSTWTKMLDILLFWAAKGVDAFRCDMVELVPSEFFRWALDAVKQRYPHVYFVAEVYDKGNYRRYADAGFDYLYDKSGFYDCLRAVLTSGRSASDLTAEWQELGGLQPRMLNFLENHDEQRVASDFFAGSARAAVPALMVSLFFNTAPFLVYFGQEFGERGMEEEGFSGKDGRTSIFDYCCVPSVKRWLQGRLSVEEQHVYSEYCRLLKTAASDVMYSRGGTFDLMYANPRSGKFNPDVHFAWLRGYESVVTLIVVNFSTVSADIEVTVPPEAFEFFGMEARRETIKLHILSRDYKAATFRR